MTLVLCPDRQKILDASGHVVVTGGPGCGKTTIALKKALVRIEAGIESDQKILFMSFSRAAVARLRESAQEVFPKRHIKNLEIQTFHSFCLRFVRGHGYLLGAPKPLTVLAPHDERTRKSEYTGADWNGEVSRLFYEEGYLSFDLFTQKAIDLLNGSQTLVRLVVDKYPLIIVDEAQDTGNWQWNLIETLSNHTQVVCLADKNQQIFDYRSDMSDKRLDQIDTALSPLRVNLGLQNNRSSGAEIVNFAYDILNNTPRGSAYRGVSHFGYNNNSVNNSIRSMTGIIRQKICDEKGKSNISIGYLTATNRGVRTISRALRGANDIREIPHRVVMDEQSVALSARVVAFCLEPVDDIWVSFKMALSLIADVYRGRNDKAKVKSLVNAYEYAQKNQKVYGRSHCPGALMDVLEILRKEKFSGDPGSDWLRIRSLFESSKAKELKYIASNVLYLMAFGCGQKIRDNLSEIWIKSDSYLEALRIVDSAILQSQVLDSSRDSAGISVMTIHKSKGREFDGVILADLFQSSFVYHNDTPPYLKARKILHVGISRARHHTLMLTCPWKESPLLEGHRLGS